MSLKINVRETGRVVILDLNGRIIIGEEAAALRNTIKDLLESGQNQILLNLAEVSYIDSTGLGQLVGSFATVTSHGGHLKLLNLQKRLQELMQITKLITVFETYDSEAAALKTFPVAASA
jgi:anti-sigma B factor antagonist